MKLSIWVTKTCNMACSYCYEEGLIREDTGVCEIDYIEKTIEFINTMCYTTASKKIFIKFFGGEPLIKFPFIKKFVEIANEKIDDKITPFYSITTNGTLMTDDMLIWLKKNNVECALSIDGDEEIYSINRRYKNRSSAWRDVDDLIPRLFDASLKLSARVTYNSKTVSKLSSSCEYLINRGFTVLKVVPDYFDSEWSDKSLEILEGQLREIDKIRNIRKNAYINLDDDELFIGRRGCAGGYSMFSIDLGGNVYPCTYVMDDKQFLLGNIENVSEIEPRYTDGTSLNREDCVGCRYFKCCKSASCLYGNYKMTGYLNKTNSFFCGYRKILYRINEEKL